jgi:hypothetical protein
VASEEEVLHLDDHVVGRVASKDSSGNVNVSAANNSNSKKKDSGAEDGENRRNSHNSNGAANKAPSPVPPSTVTVRTAAFSPIKEEPANYLPTPVGSSAAAAAATTAKKNVAVNGGGGGGRDASGGGAGATKTPFNSPNLVAAEPSRSSKAAAAPEKPERGSRDVLGIAARPGTAAEEGGAAPAPGAVDVWSSTLKDHVTLEPGAPAVLDVSVDEIAAAAVADTPAKEGKSEAPKPEEAAAPPPQQQPHFNTRDLTVDLSAPAKGEAGQAQKDCQCVVL